MHPHLPNETAGNADRSGVICRRSDISCAQRLISDQGTAQALGEQQIGMGHLPDN
jgi:hypothetical protein